jgi:hypothetical protein
MKSIMSHVRIAALLLLALGLISCGNADYYGGPPGVDGSLSISPSGFTLGFNVIKGEAWTYGGGDVVYYNAVGGTPPYYWYNAVPALASIEPLEQSNDGVYRRLRYTTKSFSGFGGGTYENVITLIDQAGVSTSVKFTISVVEITPTATSVE